MNTYKRKVTIFGLPRDWSVYRLHSELNKYTKEWNVVDIVPLEEDLTVWVNCRSEESYECFMNLKQIMPYAYPNLRVYNGTAQWHFPQPRNLQALANIFDVNLDCLIIIFDQCTLREQISLAKTCYYFYKIIMFIWRKKFSTLFFSYNRVFDYHNLSDEEVWDFCMLVGRYVKFIIFDTLSAYAVMDKYTEDINWEGNLRCSVNMKFRRHLVHFPYLEIFQIEGIYLADEVIFELARCCPRLRELQFIDAYTYFTTGKHFSSLRNLEVIDICCGMRCRLPEMLKVFDELHLKKLNIVDTRRLYEPVFFAALVRTQYSTLTTLWLSAFRDKDTILLILKLPLLKELKFFWSRSYTGFEDLLFTALLGKKHKSLHSMSFEVHERAYEMIEARYDGRMSEAFLVLKGIRDGWTLSEFALKDFFNLLNACTLLEKLTFRYCSLFTIEDIFTLPENCQSLKLIQIIGHCRKYDEKFLKEWRAREDSSCELTFQGKHFNFTEHDTKVENDKRNSPFAYRSIECNFKNNFSDKRNANET